jgi:DNA-binding transcriptional MerR regulator/methylmalonyl-CoA mutase cobalamin-binding subunit
MATCTMSFMAGLSWVEVWAVEAWLAGAWLAGAPCALAAAGAATATARARVLQARAWRAVPSVVMAASGVWVPERRATAPDFLSSDCRGILAHFPLLSRPRPEIHLYNGWTETHPSAMDTHESAEETSRSARHPIAVVAERTGLSQDVLRVWERRYGAVEPTRSAGGQRLYSDEDVERLRLLDAAVAAGRRVGHIARLPTGELARLVAEDRAAARRSAARAATAPAPATEPAPDDAVVERAIARARALDARGLDELLRRSAAVLGAPAFLERVVAPTLRRIGEEWHAGRLTIAAEHLASAVVDGIVMDALRELVADEDAPTVLVATPQGSRHVIAAALAAAAAAGEGWRVVFLGGELPAAEIAAAAVASGARAVAVSVLYADDASRLRAELRALRERLPAELPLVAGGGAVLPMGRELARAGIEVGETLDALRAALRRTLAPR